jgi:hypothetical protein
MGGECRDKYTSLELWEHVQQIKVISYCNHCFYATENRKRSWSVLSNPAIESGNIRIINKG